MKLAALVFYGEKMMFLNFIHRSKNTFTAVNLQKLIEMRSFDWRKIKLLHFTVTHLHGILRLDCIRRNICGEYREKKIPYTISLILLKWLQCGFSVRRGAFHFSANLSNTLPYNICIWGHMTSAFPKIPMVELLITE